MTLLSLLETRSLGNIKDLILIRTDGTKSIGKKAIITMRYRSKK